MHDVDRRPGRLRHRDGTLRRTRLGIDRTAVRIVAQGLAPLGREPLVEEPHHRPVLAVHQGQHARRSGLPHRLEIPIELRLEVGAGHEDLEARVAGIRERRDLGDHGVGRVRENRMQNDVHGGFAASRLEIALEGVHEGFARPLERHVANGGHPASDRGEGAAEEVIYPQLTSGRGRRGLAQVHVHVDTARKYVQARRGDLPPSAHLAADLHHMLLVNADVGHAGLPRRDEGAAPNHQIEHTASPIQPVGVGTFRRRVRTILRWSGVSARPVGAVPPARSGTQSPPDWWRGGALSRSILRWWHAESRSRVSIARSGRHRGEDTTTVCEGVPSGIRQLGAEIRSGHGDPATGVRIPSALTVDPSPIPGVSTDSESAKYYDCWARRTSRS